MGSSQRGNLSTLINTPGPGSYVQKGKIGEGPKYAMRPRTAVIMRPNGPGPGQYNASIAAINDKPPTAIMGHSSRGAAIGSAKEVPGPGAYSQLEKSKSGPSFSFGTSSGAANKKNDVPGPGTYKIPSSMAALPDYAMPNRSKEFSNI